MEKTEVTVKEVHDKFYDFPTNLGKILQDMDLNLSKDKKVFEKVQEVKNLGFKNANQHVENPEQVFQYYKKEHDDIVELSLKYPGWKFISKRGIEHLCKKYGLFHGAAEEFTGKIPEKNMKDILDSQDVKFRDSSEILLEIEVDSRGIPKIHSTDSVKIHFNVSDLINGEEQQKLHSFLSKYTCSGETRCSIKIMDQHGENLVFTHFDSPRFEENTFFITNRRQVMHALQIIRRKEVWVADLTRNIHSAIAKAQKASEIEYSIIANHTDFKELVGPEGKPIEIEIPVVQLPDPVVLKKTYKKGYYAIVTAWDKEAMDPLVFNETLN